MFEWDEIVQVVSKFKLKLSNRVFKSVKIIGTVMVIIRILVKYWTQITHS